MKRALGLCRIPDGEINFPRKKEKYVGFFPAAILRIYATPGLLPEGVKNIEISHRLRSLVVTATVERCLLYPGEPHFMKAEVRIYSNPRPPLIDNLIFGRINFFHSEIHFSWAVPPPAQNLVFVPFFTVHRMIHTCTPLTLLAPPEGGRFPSGFPDDSVVSNAPISLLHATILNFDRCVCFWDVVHHADCLNGEVQS